MAEQPGRSDLARAFLAANGLGGTSPEAIAQDASSRRYFRIPGEGLLLMDAPPPGENPAAFVAVTGLLEQLGARVPRIHAVDVRRGFILLEDLGQNTFTRLLASGKPERQLYRSALQALIKIQREFPHHAGNTSLPPYGIDATLEEAGLFADWYLPARTGRPLENSERAEFRELWMALFETLPSLPPVIVHRDFHVDNLLLCEGECAMLDYQDALVGSPLYDLVSLLEDARRDVDPSLARDLTTEWQAAFALPQKAFQDHYRFWAAQRHCKVAGIFVRLWLRDGKPGYLVHLERVMRLLGTHLSGPSTLDPLEDWLLARLPSLAHRPFVGAADELAALCHR